MIVKNDAGEDIEVFTPEEVAAKGKELETKFQGETNKLKEDLSKATEDLSKLKETDKNFGELRTAKETLEKKLTDLETNHKTEVEKLKNDVVVSQVDGLLKAIVGDDKELRKKMELHMTTTLKTMPVSSKAELEEKVKAAYRLSADVVEIDKIQGIISSAGGGGDGGGEVKISNELRAFGRNFGLEDKDWENAYKAGLI